jgi:hypothetical protein
MVARHTVDELAHDVDVASVSGRLLDHVDEERQSKGRVDRISSNRLGASRQAVEEPVLLHLAADTSEKLVLHRTGRMLGAAVVVMVALKELLLMNRFMEDGAG